MNKYKKLKHVLLELKFSDRESTEWLNSLSIEKPYTFEDAICQTLIDIHANKKQDSIFSDGHFKTKEDRIKYRNWGEQVSKSLYLRVSHKREILSVEKIIEEVLHRVESC